MAASASKSTRYIPLAGGADDGWSNGDGATATCYCGAPTHGPGLVNAFVCHCTDCRKLTASMFATNFVVADAHLRHARGADQLRTFTMRRTVAPGHAMTSHFCAVCGTLMYRVGAAHPGVSILRVGTVDDFSLHETVLRPRVEQFTKDRVGWLGAVEGVRQVEGSAYRKSAQRESL